MMARHIGVALPALWGEIFSAWKNHKRWCQEMRAVEKNLKHSLGFKVAMKYHLDHATVSRFLDWVETTGADVRKLSMGQADLLYRAWDSIFRDSDL